MDSQLVALLLLFSVTSGKDMAKLVHRRNEKLRTYAASRTTLTPVEFETWLAALDNAPTAV
jgi:hypothetical protein